MSFSALEGHRILIAEDEPLVALDLAMTVESSGAAAIIVHTLDDAIAVARSQRLSAAVVDMKLKSDLASPLCAPMNACAPWAPTAPQRACWA